jgi:hypothetical protein
VTTAAGTIPVLCDCTIFAANVIAFAFEIIRMTGSTVRSVPQPAIRNSSAYGTTVTCVTAWVVAVIAWVVSPATMAEAGRRPAVGGMTHVALYGRQ